MAETTGIKWADSTWNPWSGCTKVSPGCANCYAETLSLRGMGKNLPQGQTIGQWGKGAPRKLHESAFKLAASLNRKPWVCDACGQGHSNGAKLSGFNCAVDGCTNHTFHRRRVFSLSLGDWLDPEVPIEWLARMLSTLKACDSVTLILCSKRLELWRERLLATEIWLSQYMGDESASSERTESIGSSAKRGMVNRHAGKNMESKAAVRQPLERRNSADSMQTAQGGAGDAGWVSSGKAGKERQADLRGGSQTGVDSCERSYPAGNDRESQEWSEGGQPTGELGVGDVQRTKASFVSSAEGKTRGCEGRQSPAESAVIAGHSSDSSKATSGGIGCEDSERLPSASGHDSSCLRWTKLEASGLVGWIRSWLDGNPPSNVILLTSVENQEMANRRIPELLKIPAACHGLSCEPLLGPVDLSRWTDREQDCSRRQVEEAGGNQSGLHQPKSQPKIGWQIIGGESGSHARHCNVEWIRSLVQQGQAAGVPTFVKQLGANPIDTGVSKDYCITRGYGVTDNTSWNRAINEIKKQIKHPKGGATAEWPADLRVQEFPQL